MTTEPGTTEPVTTEPGTTTTETTDHGQADAGVHHAGTHDAEIRNETVTGLVPTPSHDEASDGRTRRRLLNRERVMHAVLELIREGDADPSLANVAERADVSHRSVFRYFDDLDDLVRSSVQFGVQNAIQLSVIPNSGEGSLPQRIDTYVETRLRLYEATHELGRVARNRSDSIPELSGAVRMVYDILRSQAAEQFDPELSRLDPADAELVLDAALVMTGFGSFDTQSHVLGHGKERIRMIWKRTLDLLLAP